MNKLTKAGLAAVPLLLVIALYFWQPGFRSPKIPPPVSPLEKLTIRAALCTAPTLLTITQEKGYFRDNGLEVSLKFFPTGPMVLEQLRAGQIDLANFSDFVLTSKILKGTSSLRCLAAIGAVDVNQMLARKDRGILQPADLKGKRIGVARGTIAEFFLGRFLTFHDVRLSEVQIIDLIPPDLPAALAGGRVDAVMAWEPATYEILRQMGEKLSSWRGQTEQKFFMILASPDEFIKAKSEVLERLFRALAQAETFIKNNQDESQAIIAKWLKIEPDVFKADWLNSEYGLSFNQGLVISMEDQARWIIRNKLVQQTKMPDFLNYFQVEPLARVVPKAVQIIIPNGVSLAAPGQSESGKER